MLDRCTRFAGAACAAAVILFLSAAPSLAQRASVPCDAFTRTSYGAWRVLGPVMLDLNGRLYAPMVGTVFPAGASHNGVEMSNVLDRQCGNR
jgi:hypothetical protein